MIYWWHENLKAFGGVLVRGRKRSVIDFADAGVYKYPPKD